MLIIDNVLPSFMAEDLESTLFSKSFPWYYLEDITETSGSKQNTIGFCHYFKNELGQTSNLYPTICWIPQFALQKANIEYKHEIIQARSFLHVPSIETRKHDNIHIDFAQNHLVVLYYVNDTDGDTFMFENGKDKEPTKRISPKKNRAVIFDGLIYHASSSPSITKRCIINFNLV